MEIYFQSCTDINIEKALESCQNNSQEKNCKKDYKCKLCVKNLINVVILPCSHMLSCSECFSKISNCPTCREEIVSYIHCDDLTKRTICRPKKKIKVDELICKICKNYHVNKIALPCTHMSICSHCVKEEKN